MTGLEIEIPPMYRTYVEGQNFNTAGMKVVAKYGDGTTKEVKQKIIVTHDFEEITQEATCKEKGYIKQICKVCGLEVVKTKIAALGHNYENGVCTRCGEIEPVIRVSSEKYSVDNEHDYIKNVGLKTTVQEIKAALTTNATEVKIYKGEKELKETDTIGTNTKVYFKNSNDERILTIIVTGDTDGNGEADFCYMLAINKHRLGIKLLGEVEKLAGDINKDGDTGFWDMLIINKYRLGLTETL